MNMLINMMFKLHPSDIVYNGIERASGLSGDKRICIQDNVTHNTADGKPVIASFGNVNLGSGITILIGPVSRDASVHNCAHDTIAGIELEPFPPLPKANKTFSAEAITALCNAQTDDVN